MSDGLAAFLAARLDEDDAAALRVLGMWRLADPATGVIVATDGCNAERVAEAYWAGAGEHIVRHDPARTQREVQMMRTLLRYFTDPFTHEPMSVVIATSAAEIGRGRGAALPGSWILREMAAVYSDHPDYRPEWKP